MSTRYGLNTIKAYLTTNLISSYYTEVGKSFKQSYPHDKKKANNENFYGLFKIVEGAGFLETVHGTLKLNAGDIIFVNYYELVNHISNSNSYKYYSSYFYLDNFNLKLYTPFTDSSNEELFEEIINLQKKGDFLSLCNANAHFQILLCGFLARLNIQSNVSPYHNEINSAVEYIRKNIHEPIKISELAAMCNICPKYFSTLFTAQIGMSPKNYIMKSKMETASYYLLYTTNTIAQISNSLSFFSPAYFTYSFQKYMGTTPSEYRKQQDLYLNSSPKFQQED